MNWNRVKGCQTLALGIKGSYGLSFCIVRDIREIPSSAVVDHGTLWSASEAASSGTLTLTLCGFLQYSTLFTVMLPGRITTSLLLSLHVSSHSSPVRVRGWRWQRQRAYTDNTICNKPHLHQSRSYVFGGVAPILSENANFKIKSQPFCDYHGDSCLTQYWTDSNIIGISAFISFIPVKLMNAHVGWHQQEGNDHIYILIQTYAVSSLAWVLQVIVEVLR